MPKTGTATLPLHYGKAPRWLFDRMSALSRELTYALVHELGREAFLKKIADPCWFQALGCVLGFDWHSSGLTTTVTGALKEGLKGMERELGIYIAGGKGTTARKTPEQILKYSDRYGINPGPLIYASRMSAKIDSTAVQDGYQLYHHVFIFTGAGRWSVIQQGMNRSRRTARRYHWLGERIRDFVVEPHAAVCCDHRGASVNMVAQESDEARNVCTLLAKERPEKVVKEINRLTTLELTSCHSVTSADIHPKRLYRTLLRTYEKQPENFEKLLGIQGVGPKTIRALSLVSELVYGKPPSYRDPARFSFAHGGKDGTPFPVDRRTYDKTIEIMKTAINAARIGNRGKITALMRLSKYFEH